ncbi:MAG: hypothetical protein ACU0BB_16265 [Paracoccaceae bacterium]
MTAALTIPKGERGEIRIFSLDMATEQVRFLLDEKGALEQILGVNTLDHEYVEIFALEDLEDLGLAGYLIEGCGVPEVNISATYKQLSSLTGNVLLIRSRAFMDMETTLTPAAPVVFIGIFSEKPTDWSAEPLSTDSAKPYSAPPLQNKTVPPGFPWRTLIFPGIIIISALVYKLVIAP